MTSKDDMCKRELESQFAASGQIKFRIRTVPHHAGAPTVHALNVGMRQVTSVELQMFRGMISRLWVRTSAIPSSNNVIRGRLLGLRDNRFPSKRSVVLRDLWRQRRGPFFGRPPFFSPRSIMSCREARRRDAVSKANRCRQNHFSTDGNTSRMACHWNHRQSSQ